MDNAQTPLLIKRYTSRRLYNTETSDYITLQEISDCIRAGRDVKIVDLKTGDDLTRQYLLQIITEHESNGEQVLPLNVLMEVVRAYNKQTQDLVPRFLDTAFEIIKDRQTQLLENLRTFPDPMSAYEEIGRRQRAFFTKSMGSWMGDQPKKCKNSESAETETEIDELKEMVANLQAKVDNLSS